MTTTATIDYWDIVVRSLTLTWKNKFLWFFGFFASSGAGTSFLNWTEEGGPSVAGFLRSHLEILAVMILGIVVLWLVLFVLSLISKGALIGAGASLDSGESASFSDAWARGLTAFWKILVLLIIGVVIFVAVALVCAIPVVLPLAAGSSGITISVIIGAVLFLPFLAFLFLLAFTITYAEREAVVANAGITESLRMGWEMTRAYFLKSLLVWLIELASSLLFVIGLVVVGLLLALPFILIWTVSHFVALLIGIPVGIIYLSVAIGAFGTYEHMLWTLTYRDLRALAEGAEARAPSGQVPVREWPPA